MHTSDLSLRERNRADTWLAIHNAAADHVLEHGWAATTVDKIATRAGISNRTFFNYFPTKEDAILGSRTPAIPDSALEAFQSSEDDLIHRTVQLTIAIIRASYPHDETRARRHRLITQFPELAGRTKHLAAAVETLVEPVVTAEIERLGPERIAQLHASPQEAARALSLYAATIIRFAFSKDPTAIADRRSEAVEFAITTFREVVQASTWLTR